MAGEKEDEHHEMKYFMKFFRYMQMMKMMNHDDDDHESYGQYKPMQYSQMKESSSDMNMMEKMKMMMMMKKMMDNKNENYNDHGNMDMQSLFGNLGVEVTKEELKEKIDEVDIERNGKVSFSEFVALMRETITDIHDEKRLKEAFTIFDSDGNGEIDIGELDKMMKKLGQELEIDQIKEMIKTADLDRDGKISWDEFKKFMQSPN